MISDNSRERTLTSSAVAGQIRAERNAKHWTVDEMAARSGIPRSSYYKLETGKRVADVSQLEHICHALEISISAFFGLAEERASRETTETDPP